MKIQRNPLIYSKKIDGKWILLEKNREFARELNDTAGIVWEMCREPVAIEKIVKAISLEFHQDPDAITQDALTFIRDYLSQGFIVELK